MTIRLSALTLGTVCAGLCLGAATTARADEGMWLYNRFPAEKLE